MMKIQLWIDGEQQTFVAPFVPALAKRKYYEWKAKAEKEDAAEEGLLTAQQIIDDDDEILSILPNVVFKEQFTLDQLYAGASMEYIQAKLKEAVFGIKPEAVAGANDGETGK